MPLHWSFGHSHPKLWAKEGPGVKLTVWLPTTKSWESTSFRPLNCDCNTSLKRSRQGLQVWLDLVAIRLCSWKLWAPKVPGLQPGQFRDNFETPTWESREKKPFGCSLRGTLQRILYGEGGGFPQVRTVVCLVVQSARGLFQHPGCPGMWTNHLGGLFWCRFKLDLLNLLPSLIPGLLACPSTPL
jgi:hypothetical protein